MDIIKEKMLQLASLQKKIRQQHIYIPKNYCGTIDPDIARMEATEGYIKIEVDIYEPICPAVFFRPETDRIIFIEKESYYEGTLNETGYPGCNKAEIYGGLDWDGLGQDKVKLYQNAARCAFELLEGRPMDFHLKSDQEIAVRRFRENVVFVNVNSFPRIVPPGSGKSSDDRMIYKWAQINRQLITELVNLYDAETVIGGSTLTHFCNPENSTIFGQKVNILNNNSTHAVLGNSGIIYWNNDRVFINAYHCSHTGFPSQIGAIAQIRNNWKEREMKKWEENNYTNNK